MSTAALFQPLAVGPITLSHRIVMAPLTRMRATIPGEAPTALNALYYGQRATQGGLIIAEASQVVPGGRLAPSTPGIHSSEQIAGWKDTVQVRPDETVSILAHFTDYADPVNPYMYHCHILEHEDRGMMGQFTVVE